MPENKLKKFFSSRATLFLLLLAFIWLSLVLAKAFYKKQQLNQEIEALKSEREKTEKKGQELSELLGYFNNQDFLEKEAKDKLNLKKEGESVVMVQGGEVDAAVAIQENTPETVAEKSQEVKESNFIKWWNFFFRR